MQSRTGYGIDIKIFTANDGSYHPDFNNDTLIPLADHTHEGSGTGYQLHGTRALIANSLDASVVVQDGTITSNLLADDFSFAVFDNNTTLQWRNAADTADLDAIKVNTNDRLEFLLDIDEFIYSNNRGIIWLNTSGNEVACLRYNSSNQFELMENTYTKHLLPQTTATYDLGSSSLRYRNAYFSSDIYLSGSSTAFYKSSTSFTPTVIGSTSAGTATYSTQTGNYTRIGDVVVASVSLTWTSGTGTGNMKIGGLPLTASASGTFISACVFKSADYLLQVDNSATTASVLDPDTGSAVTYDSADTLIGTLIYNV